MVVEDDAETELACGGDDVVEDLHRVEAVEIGVDRLVIRGVEANGLRNLRRLDHLVRERQADGVVPLRLDRTKDVVVVLEREAAGDATARFEAAPVDTGDADFPLLFVEDAVAVGVPVAGAVGEERG